VSVRLHLGCGLVHRANWVNLDRYPTDAADLLADAILLPFPDGCAQAVEALQLVEHLGYVGTLYALHEWARVLTPGGTLRIETPDRAATLSAALSEESDKAALPWLFGMEERGLIHRYLFSADELTRMVGQAGFTDVTLRNATHQPAGPTLALSARRAADTRRHRLANRLRRTFILAGLVDPMDTPQHMSALELICERACELAEAPDHATLDQALSLAARHSPRAAACLLGALSAFSVWSDEELAQAIHLVADLEREHFPARLACRWRAIPKPPGTADRTWASFEREISLYLVARLCPGEGLDDVKAAFDASTAHPSPTDRRLKFFCRAALTDLARQLTARGVRAFAQGDLESAREAFETALSYDPTLVWPRWNLARLHMRAKQPLDALKHYEALQVELPAGLRTAFERELDAVTRGSRAVDAFGAPVADVSDLLT
jgi:predicted SAM-dependent methyltransferase